VEGKWDGLIAGLDAKRYDVVFNEVTITNARKAKYDFSDVYIVSKVALVVRNDNTTLKSYADLKGKKAGVVPVDGFNQAVGPCCSGREIPSSLLPSTRPLPTSSLTGHIWQSRGSISTRMSRSSLSWRAGTRRPPRILGGFDLSVGSVASLADAVVLSMYVWHGMGTVGAILVVLAAGALVGTVNAVLIVGLRIPDMLATPAGMFVVQGIAMTYSLGGSITPNMMMPDGSIASGGIGAGFAAIGQVPLIIVLMAASVLVVQVFQSTTRRGRYLYMIGGNAEAARLSGITAGRHRAAAYVLSALFAAAGGIMLASRIGSSQVNAGSAYLMDAVAAAYIGFSLGGSNKPNATGTFVGAALIGVLQNGLVMFSVPYYAMDIVKGGVLALALAVTCARRK
jgi:simple sugar transport system permease protein